MRELVYAMRFTGQATPVGAAGNVLAASTTALSAAFSATVGPSGLAGEIQFVDGGQAEFTSEVTFTGDHRFQEVGTIAFGGNNVLHFSTIGSGYLGASSDDARRHGAVVWSVERGEGQFAGATGLITSNFTVDERLGIIDHHLGVLLLA